MQSVKGHITFCGALLFLLLLPWLPARGAGRDSTRLAVEARFHHGFVVPHHTSMTYLLNDYARGGELNLLRQRFGSDCWENYLRRPETGLGLWYSTFGRSDIYGEGWALYPFINFHILETGPLQLRYRVALGLGYANKPFKVGENTYNTVFGSHLNAYVGFGLQATYRIHRHWRLSTGASLNHMSNGSSRKPNNGINTVAWNMGLSYDLQPFSHEQWQRSKAPRSAHREWVFSASMGRNQAAAYNPTRYWSGSITVNHLWYRTSTRAYGVGLDLLKFGGAPLASMNFQDLDVDQHFSSSDEIYAGILAGMESLLGTTALYINLGTYLYQATPARQPVYARLGVRQKLYQNWHGHFGIKANFFTAEFIEFGLAYRLPRSRDKVSPGKKEKL